MDQGKGSLSVGQLGEGLVVDLSLLFGSQEVISASCILDGSGISDGHVLCGGQIVDQTLNGLGLDLLSKCSFVSLELAKGIRVDQRLLVVGQIVISVSCSGDAFEIFDRHILCGRQIVDHGFNSVGFCNVVLELRDRSFVEDELESVGKSDHSFLCGAQCIISSSGFFDGSLVIEGHSVCGGQGFDQSLDLVGSSFVSSDLLGVFESSLNKGKLKSVSEGNICLLVVGQRVVGSGSFVKSRSVLGRDGESVRQRVDQGGNVVGSFHIVLDLGSCGLSVGQLGEGFRVDLSLLFGSQEVISASCIFDCGEIICSNVLSGRQVVDQSLDGLGFEQLAESSLCSVQLVKGLGLYQCFLVVGQVFISVSGFGDGVDIVEGHLLGKRIDKFFYSVSGSDVVFDLGNSRLVCGEFYSVNEGNTSLLLGGQGVIGSLCSVDGFLVLDGNGSSAGKRFDHRFYFIGSLLVQCACECAGNCGELHSVGERNELLLAVGQRIIGSLCFFDGVLVLCLYVGSGGQRFDQSLYRVSGSLVEGSCKSACICGELGSVNERYQSLLVVGKCVVSFLCSFDGFLVLCLYIVSGGQRIDQFFHSVGSSLVLGDLNSRVGSALYHGELDLCKEGNHCLLVVGECVISGACFVNSRLVGCGDSTCGGQCVDHFGHGVCGSVVSRILFEFNDGDQLSSKLGLASGGDRSLLLVGQGVIGSLGVVDGSSVINSQLGNRRQRLDLGVNVFDFEVGDDRLGVGQLLEGFVRDKLFLIIGERFISESCGFNLLLVVEREGLGERVDQVGHVLGGREVCDLLLNVGELGERIIRYHSLLCRGQRFIGVSGVGDSLGAFECNGVCVRESCDRVGDRLRSGEVGDLSLGVGQLCERVCVNQRFLRVGQQVISLSCRYNV